MRRDDSGQLMIIAALGMAAFLGFAALVVDLGYAYSQRRLAQNAADAGAMAAVRLIRTSSPSTAASVVYTEIQRVAALNGNSQVDSANTLFLDISGSSLGPAASFAGSLESVAGVQVRTQIQYNTFFAGIVGIDSLTSAGRSSAMSVGIGSVTTETGLRPIAVPNQTYQPGTTYTIWDSDREAPGNAGWLDFNAGSNPEGELEDWFAHGFPYPSTQQFGYWDGGGSPGDFHTGTTLPFPAWVAGDPGLKSAVQDELAALKDQEVTVLIYETLTGTGQNSQYRLLGVATFIIREVDLSGNPKTVKGEFVRSTLPGDSSSSYTTGLMSTVRLVPDSVPTSAPTATSLPTATVSATSPPWPTDTPTPTPGVAATATPTATPVSPPAAPSGLSVVEAGSNAMNLSWVDNSSNESGFYIERSLDEDGPFSQVGSVGASVTTFNDTGLSSNTWYYYRVRAYNAGGTSAYTSVEKDKTRN